MQYLVPEAALHVPNSVSTRKATV